MNIYNLRYFVTLARIRQYTKAAEELCITQPSLSHAISQMEKELGVKLFEKNGHKITLTQFGEEFLSYEEIIELYRKGELDEVYIIYTSMINAIQEETQIEQLLPLKKADFNIQIPVDFKREELALKPSPEVVMDRIVPDYIVGFVYGALVESFSCEQNARMMAMEAASKSAKDMLHDLDIQYNRARQASITQEITEVIAGAKSQKKKRKK